MPTIEELSAKADELQTALDTEQQQVKDLLDQKDTAITGLNEVITDLRAQLADGGTTEQRQALLDKLNGIKTDLESTVVADDTDEDEETDTGGGAQ